MVPYLSSTGKILTVAETPPGMLSPATTAALAPVAEPPLPEALLPATTAAASGKTAAAALFKALVFPLYIRNAMVSHATGIKMSNL